MVKFFQQHHEMFTRLKLPNLLRQVSTATMSQHESFNINTMIRLTSDPTSNTIHKREQLFHFHRTFSF